ncbi:protein mobC [Caballeronia grimmiae]|uniref:protein mobC n=1 Tax=Caballeronia grimmiae TaxID=1071679 RepID=UPI0038BE0DAA
MKLTTEKIEAIALKLRELPPIEKKKAEVSKQEAVKLLSKEIAAMQKRGYTLLQISEALRGEGLNIATPTLKTYLQKARPVRKPSVKNANETLSGLKPADGGTRSFTPQADSDEI